MSKNYRDYEPDQLFLMPPSLREWLPEDHLAYFISDLVDDLNLCEIEGTYRDENRGQPPYHPRMMLKVLLYSYCVGVFAQDSEAIGRRYRVSGAGSRQYSRFSYAERFSQEIIAVLFWDCSGRFCIWRFWQGR
jgi:hypothetical protein